MTPTKKSGFSASSYLAGSLRLLSLSTLALASFGCNAGLELRPPKAPSFEAKAQFGGAAQAEVAPASYVAGDSTAAASAPAPSNYPQSGGGSIETAEPTSPGSTIAGRVAKGAPRFYAVDMAVGDSISMKVYGRQLTGGFTYLEVALMEPDMVDLGRKALGMTGGPDKLERSSFSVVASQAGRHFIKVKSDTKPAEYRIEITSLSQAAP